MSNYYETDHDSETPWATANGNDLILRVQSGGVKPVKRELQVRLYSLQDFLDLEAAVQQLRAFFHKEDAVGEA
jgi:hypothetical protein